MLIPLSNADPKRSYVVFTVQPSPGSSAQASPCLSRVVLCFRVRCLLGLTGQPVQRSEAVTDSLLTDRWQAFTCLLAFVLGFWPTCNTQRRTCLAAMFVLAAGNCAGASLALVSCGPGLVSRSAKAHFDALLLVRTCAMQPDDRWLQYSAATVSTAPPPSAPGPLALRVQLSRAEGAARTGLC